MSNRSSPTNTKFPFSMPGIKFIHTADLHLDTPFTGLSQWNPELAGKLKNATFNSFGRIVELCIREEVDFLLVAGDTFNSKNQSLAAQLKFVNELKKLSDNGIACYFVCGNHDPLSSWMEQLQLPANVHRFGSKEAQSVTFHRNDRALADIYGISFETESVYDNLAQKIIHCRMGKPDPAPFQVAIMHGTAGSQGPHKKYAPFGLEEVAGQKFDYWALGHVHKRQVLRPQHPAVVYPGNPQGRDFGETGSRGCCLVEIRESAAPEIRFVPTQVIRFEELVVDLTGEDSINGLQKRIDAAVEALEGPGLTDGMEHQAHMDATESPGPSVAYRQEEAKANFIIRLLLKGQTPLHGQLGKPGELEQLLQVFNEGQLSRDPFTWYDSIRLETGPELDLDQVRQGTDFPAEVLRQAEAMAADPQRLEDFLLEAQEAFGNPLVRRELAELTAEDRAEMAEMAKWMLLENLQTK
jgi:DNA repair protein SbcD/Mre11